MVPVEGASFHEGFGWWNPACLAHGIEEGVPSRDEMWMSSMVLCIVCNAASNCVVDHVL